MSKLITAFNEFKKLDYTLSIEEERDIIAKYVHSTNQLEGNQLTLEQTKTIIDKGVLSGENINLKDVLEQKGTYKALLRMINAVIIKEPLTIELIKELNWLCIGLLYQDDYYLSYKKEAQKQ
jgi:Fic family protein